MRHLPLPPAPRANAAKRQQHFAGYDFTSGPEGTTVRRQAIDTARTGDYGADPLGDGTFRMVPSGDIVDYEERSRRLNRGARTDLSSFRLNSGEGSEGGGRTVGMFHITLEGGTRRDPMADEAYGTAVEAAEAMRAELGWRSIFLTEPYRDTVGGDGVVAQSAYETAAERDDAPDADPAPQIFRVEDMQQNGGDWRVVTTEGGITGSGFRSKAEAVRHAKHMFSVTTGGDQRQRVQRYEMGSADDPGMWVTVERIDDMRENAHRRTHSVALSSARDPVLESRARQLDLVEMDEMRRMLAKRGYHPEDVVKLREGAIPMGPEELSHILRTTEPGGMGSLEYAYGLKRDYSPNARKGSGWQEFDTEQFPVGSQVKLTGTFLRSTGQIAGGEGSKVWTVMPYSERRGQPDYTFVNVDEPPGNPEMYEDLPPSERPKYRRINAMNLMPARGGKMKARYFPNAHDSGSYVITVRRPSKKVATFATLEAAKASVLGGRWSITAEDSDGPIEWWSKSTDASIRFMEGDVTPNARRDAEPDEHAATELLLYIENESDLSPQGPSGQGRSIAQNLLRKMAKGKYDHALAPKLWLYLVESGGKRYSKEFGGGEREWSRTFTPATRDVVAQALADQFRDAVAAGEYEGMDYRTGAR
jgi:hypothetical protein